MGHGNVDLVYDPIGSRHRSTRLLARRGDTSHRLETLQWIVGTPWSTCGHTPSGRQKRVIPPKRIAHDTRGTIVHLVYGAAWSVRIARGDRRQALPRGTRSTVTLAECAT